jgi:hypothetical protein
MCPVRKISHPLVMEKKLEQLLLKITPNCHCLIDQSNLYHNIEAMMIKFKYNSQLVILHVN